VTQKSEWNYFLIYYVISKAGLHSINTYRIIATFLKPINSNMKKKCFLYWV